MIHICENCCTFAPAKKVKDTTLDGSKKTTFNYMNNYITNQEQAMAIVEQQRKLQGKAIEELCSGICHKSSYYRWMKGEALVSVNDFARLCQRLDVDLTLGTSWFPS